MRHFKFGDNLRYQRISINGSIILLFIDVFDIGLKSLNYLIFYYREIESSLKEVLDERLMYITLYEKTLHEKELIADELEVGRVGRIGWVRQECVGYGGGGGVHQMQKAQFLSVDGLWGVGGGGSNSMLEGTFHFNPLLPRIYRT